MSVMMWKMMDNLSIKDIHDKVYYEVWTQTSTILFWKTKREMDNWLPVRIRRIVDAELEGLE